MTAAGVVVELRDIVVEFSGVRALKGVSTIVGSGEWLGVVGPNGSGKTTLMNAITGIYPVSEGSIVFRGSEIGMAGPLSRQRCGIVRSFQHEQLAATLTLAESVALGLWTERDHTGGGWFREWLRRERRDLARAHDVLGEVGCAEYADALPREVPQGVRRLAEIARALIPEQAGLLLLDEPAAGLSEEERDRLRGVLEHVRTGRRDLSVMLIEHDVAFVADETTRVLALDAGTVIGDGPTAEVLRSDAVGVAFLGRPADADDH